MFRNSKCTFEKRNDEIFAVSDVRTDEAVGRVGRFNAVYFDKIRFLDNEIIRALFLNQVHSGV